MFGGYDYLKRAFECNLSYFYFIKPLPVGEVAALTLQSMD